jgi:magnesium-protoporphyrin O-methyltransferase
MVRENALQHAAQLRQYFDGDGYDRWVAIYQGDEELSYIRRTVREGHQQMLDQAQEWLLDVCPQGTLLDAGCGTGLFSISMARAGFGVSGVDISPRMVAVAREDAAGAAPSADIQFEVGDIQSASGTYDAVTCFDVLVHYPRDFFVPLCQHLAHRSTKTLLLTYAPYSHLLSFLHWVGGFFPKGSRRTEIQMIPDRVVEDTLAAAGMTVTRTTAVSHGFYHVKLLQAVRTHEART